MTVRLIADEMGHEVHNLLEGIDSDCLLDVDVGVVIVAVARDERVCRETIQCTG